MEKSTAALEDVILLRARQADQSGPGNFNPAEVYSAILPRIVTSNKEGKNDYWP